MKKIFAICGVIAPWIFVATLVIGIAFGCIASACGVKIAAISISSFVGIIFLIWGIGNWIEWSYKYMKEQNYQKQIQEDISVLKKTKIHNPKPSKGEIIEVM